MFRIKNCTSILRMSIVIRPRERKHIGIEREFMMNTIIEIDTGVTIPSYIIHALTQ